MAGKRSNRLWKISISISSEAEEAVVELLTELFSRPASVYADAEKKTTSASVYVSAFPANKRAELRRGLRNIRDCGIALGPGRISVRTIRREDWAESWKRHFKPIEISPKLLVKPSWSARRPKPNQAVVILDPGLSFGTGQHPTTSFCLEQIARLRKSDTSQSFLDIGTGSGILAVAAAKLGYARILAFDFDPDAVRIAKQNAAVNRVEITIRQQDLTKLPLQSSRRFSVVCANLTYDLLIQERDRILSRLEPTGSLVLAGILRKQFPAVRGAYVAAGMKLVAQRSAGEWQSGAFLFA